MADQEYYTKGDKEIVGSHIDELEAERTKLEAAMQSLHDESRALKTVTSADSPYQILATDSKILVDASGGVVTVNLPDPADLTDAKEYRVKAIDITNNITIGSASGDVEGGASVSITNAGGTLDGYIFDTDGTDWHAMAKF